MAVSSNHLYVKAEPAFLKFFLKKINAKQYLVPSRSLQFESRVLSLFQAVGSCSRKGISAGWVLQSARLRLLFLAPLVTESVDLYILKISILLVENCWSKLHFAQQRTPSPSFKQQSFFQYQTIQMVHHRFLDTGKSARLALSLSRAIVMSWHLMKFTS